MLISCDFCSCSQVLCILVSSCLVASSSVLLWLSSKLLIFFQPLASDLHVLPPEMRQSWAIPKSAKPISLSSAKKTPYDRNLSRGQKLSRDARAKPREINTWKSEVLSNMFKPSENNISKTQAQTNRYDESLFQALTNCLILPLAPFIGSHRLYANLLCLEFRLLISHTYFSQIFFKPQRLPSGSKYVSS